MIRKALYRGIPCYYDTWTGELSGRNYLLDLLVAFNMWFDFRVLDLEELPIYILDE